MRDAGVNWSQGTLSRVENGDRPLRFSEAGALAAALDTTRDLVGVETDSLVDTLLERFSGEQSGIEDEISDLQRDLQAVVDTATVIEAIQALGEGRDIGPVEVFGRLPMLPDDADPFEQASEPDDRSDPFRPNAVALLSSLPVFEVLTLLRMAGADEAILAGITPSAFANSPKARGQEASEDWLRRDVSQLLHRLRAAKRPRRTTKGANRG